MTAKSIEQLRLLEAGGPSWLVRVASVRAKKSARGLQGGEGSGEVSSTRGQLFTQHYRVSASPLTSNSQCARA
jgi:hypothetical protein